MLERRYLPERTVFERYHPRLQFRLITGYHRKLAAKYRYFVRHQLGTDCPFYTNESIDELTGTLDCHEVIDCGWQAAEWAVRPRSYNVTAGVTTEVYQGPSAFPHMQGYNPAPIAYKRDGAWIAKYFFGRDCSYWRTVGEDSWHMRSGGTWAGYYAGQYQVGTFTSRKSSGNSPTDVIYSVLRQMNAKKWAGFYDDEIDFIVETTGLRKDQI